MRDIHLLIYEVYKWPALRSTSTKSHNKSINNRSYFKKFGNKDKNFIMDFFKKKKKQKKKKNFLVKTKKRK